MSSFHIIQFESFFSMHLKYFYIQAKRIPALSVSEVIVADF